MPWKEMKIVEQRVEFVRAVERERESFTSICEEFGISRKTGYKWLNRYRNHESVDALKDQSRAPDWSPNRVHPCVVHELCRLRRRHRHWGPKKLLVKMPVQYRRQYKIPSLSTASRILKKAGLVKCRKRRRKTPLCTNPFTKVSAPNQLWCIDFKGHFKCVNGVRIYPLTVTDAFSRYILCCQAVVEPRTDSVLKILKRLFRKYGLPGAIRSDNGAPFASVGVGGLSELSIWWTRLGIIHERIEPGKPQQNGRHERMHLTLKQEVCMHPSRSVSAQQQAFNKFVHEFNYERPHEAIGMKTPNEIYVKSARLYEAQMKIVNLPELERGHVLVSKSGKIEWQGHKIKIGTTLINQCLEVRKAGSNSWSFHFGPHKLGTFDYAKLGKRPKQSVTHVLKQVVT